MILRGGEEADIHLSRIYLRWGGGGEVEPTFGQIFFATPENFTIKLRKQGTHLSGHLLKINRFFYDNIINDVSMTRIIRTIHNFQISASTSSMELEVSQNFSTHIIHAGL